MRLQHGCILMALGAVGAGCNAILDNAEHPFAEHSTFDAAGADDSSDATIGHADAATSEGAPPEHDATFDRDAQALDARGPEAAGPDGDAAPPVTCTAGGYCNLGDCQQGIWACNDGGAVCLPSATAQDGTPCASSGPDAGVAHVCRAGGCVPCSAGSDCADAGSCERMTIRCSSGSPLCVAAGPVQDGLSCGTGPALYCYGGVCSACTLNASCAPGNPCNAGKVTSCTGGVAVCTDQGSPAPAGKACVTGSVPSGVCDGNGACVACTPNATCQPSTCQIGTVSCNSGPACGSLASVNEGRPCGTPAGQICHLGTCVACNASSCPNGCCAASGCVTVSQENNSACGTGGAQCGPCATGTTCQSGQCVGPSLSLSPMSFTFPTTATGTRSASQSFVVSNSGNGPSGALTTALGGSNPADFIFATDGCNGQLVQAGASCTLNLQFAPSGRGPRAAALTLNGGMLSAALTGTGEDFVTLSVTKSGTGGGTVAGDQIACGGVCTEQVARPSVTDPTVTLTATPDATSVFSAWSGACAGTATTCTVTMSQAQTVNAQFSAKVPVTVVFHALSGQAATLTSNPPGVSCSGSTCTQTAQFVGGSSVTLTVAGMSAGALIGWSNGCSGTSCTFTSTSAQTIYVTTTLNNLVFTTSATTNGAVGVAGADAACATAAGSGGLPGHYVAFLSTTATSAFTRLGSARGWIRPDGLPFGDTVASIQGNVTFYPAQLTETAGPLAVGLFPWTGISSGGGAAATCSDWTTASSTVQGWLGEASGGSTAWQSQSLSACSALWHLYCFETDFASAVTVPPAAGRRGFITANAYPVAGIAAADASCRSEAQSAGLANSANFLAVLTTTASASSRFNLNGANWIRPDNVALAVSPSAFMADQLIAPITVQANAAVMPNANAYAWLGASADTPAPVATDTCNDWSTTSSSATASVALPSAPYFPSAIQACSTTQLYICLEN